MRRELPGSTGGLLATAIGISFHIVLLEYEGCATSGGQLPLGLLTPGGLQQDFFGRAKEFRGLDAQGCTCRTRLHTCLVAIPCAEVALDRDLLAQFIVAAARREDIERPGRDARSAGSLRTNDRQHSVRSFASHIARKPGAKALPGIANRRFLLDLSDRDGSI